MVRTFLGEILGPYNTVIEHGGTKVTIDFQKNQKKQHLISNYLKTDQ